MHPRGSPLWGVMMGAVGLTFLIVAAFLGFVAKRGGELDPSRTTAEPAASAEPAAPGEASAPDAALPDSVAVDAGAITAAPPSDAGASSDELQDASLSDGAQPEPAASASKALSKKSPAPTKAKPKPKWRSKHR